MAKLGVVTCQILELESDTQKPVHRVTEVNEFSKEEANGLAVLVQVLEWGFIPSYPI